MEYFSSKKVFETIRICTLLVTHTCNLNCTYCFEKNKSEKLENMTFDTAKSILEKELDLFEKQTRKPNQRFAIEFFGGEPLLNFSLIESVYFWVKNKNLSFPYTFQITTNGTLLNAPKKAFFEKYKKDFRIILSIDGDEHMQFSNRGQNLKREILNWSIKNWPDSYFHMTVSRETLPNYAKGVIELYKQGFVIASSMAEGINWKDEDYEIYRQELKKIAQFYLDNKKYRIESPFNRIYKELLDPFAKNPIPAKCCGAGTAIILYDIDGQSVPCHLFSSVVNKNYDFNEIQKLDFSNPEKLISEKCKKCPILKVCRTCLGYNYNERGDIRNRDSRKCKIMLIEAQEVSSFIIRYLMDQKENLKNNDLLALKGALRCFELTNSIKF